MRERLTSQAYFFQFEKWRQLIFGVIFTHINDRIHLNSIKIFLFLFHLLVRRRLLIHRFGFFVIFSRFKFIHRSPNSNICEYLKAFAVTHSQPITTCQISPGANFSRFPLKIWRAYKLFPNNHQKRQKTKKSVEIRSEKASLTHFKATSQLIDKKVVRSESNEQSLITRPFFDASTSKLSLD